MAILAPPVLAAVVLVGALWPLGYSALSPTEGDHGAVVVENERATNVTAVAYVVQGPVTEVDVTFRNGTTTRIERPDDLGMHYGVFPRHVESMAPADGVVLYHDTVTVAPGEAHTLVEMTPHLPHVTVLTYAKEEGGGIERAIKWDCEEDLVSHVEILVERAGHGTRTSAGCVGWEEALPTP